ncbi:hypothetical protein [Algoriphagus aquimarinus]|uniref:Uncharacterized protein n=1 Tax=Algoriphagus aquimarinus TaxID=237018 RepID=A0A1I1A214_9BACT|nr:hypothetical protein [Algoriphagus aquimarinus]SFB31947.1 hypothetical protein SAMN04489723_107116 [Algoriphagus aquimarinus]|tara:strand:- start:8553 stop:8933 length:381 start_codon:yes stop_codon:yes gene_type:complete
MKNLFTLFLTVFLITSCTEDNSPEGVLIRVENGSAVDFKDILISSGSTPIEFGDISAGQRSDYKEFESAYRYGFVSLLANGKELRMQPYDYVGETPLSKGYYTYKLNLDTSDPNNPHLTLDLLIVN